MGFIGFGLAKYPGLTLCDQLRFKKIILRKLLYCISMFRISNPERINTAYVSLIFNPYLIFKKMSLGDCFPTKNSQIFAVGARKKPACISAFRDKIVKKNR